MVIKILAYLLILVSVVLTEQSQYFHEEPCECHQNCAVDCMHCNSKDCVQECLQEICEFHPKGFCDSLILCCDESECKNVEGWRKYEYDPESYLADDYNISLVPLDYVKPDETLMKDEGTKLPSMHGVLPIIDNKANTASGGGVGDAAIIIIAEEPDEPAPDYTDINEPDTDDLYSDEYENATGDDETTTEDSSDKPDERELEPVTIPLLEPEIETTTEIDVATESVTESESVTYSEEVTEDETEPITNSETETESATEIDMETESVTEQEPVTYPEEVTEAETEAVTDSETEPGPATETEPTTVIDVETESVTESKSVTHPEEVTEAETQPIIVSEQEPDLEPEIEPKTETETESTTEIDVVTESVTESVTYPEEVTEAATERQPKPVTDSAEETTPIVTTPRDPGVYPPIPPPPSPTPPPIPGSTTPSYPQYPVNVIPCCRVRIRSPCVVRMCVLCCPPDTIREICDPNLCYPPNIIYYQTIRVQNIPQPVSQPVQYSSYPFNYYGK